MNNEDVLDLEVLDAFDHESKRSQRGRTRYGQARNGHSSLLWMIQYELGTDLERKDEPRTKLQGVAQRFVTLMLTGSEPVALQAMKLYLAYSEGEPRQLVQFEMVRVARSIAEKKNLDPQKLIERANAIAAEMGF